MKARLISHHKQEVTWVSTTSGISRQVNWECHCIFIAHWCL